MIRLLDRTWPWPALSALALAALIVLVSVIAAPAKSDADRIADRVQSLARAAAEHNGATLCAQFTAAGRRRIEQQVPRLGCEQIARSFGVGVPGDQLRDAPREPPRITGARATVEAPSIGVRVVLQRVDGDWLVGGFESFPAR